MQAIRRIKKYYRSVRFFWPMIMSVVKLQEWMESFEEQIRAAQLLREPSETVEGNLDGKQNESDTK